MFKKLSDMEKAMRSILIQIKDSNNCHLIFNTLSTDSANALYECVNRKYVNNVDTYPDADGYYHFASLGNTHVNADGLKFIRDLSFWHRSKTAIVDLIKGIRGFILGILSTVIAEYIIWILINKK